MPERVNILVIDDTPGQRLSIEVTLADLGERIVCVPSGREALKFLLNNEAAVILLDVNMPEMDGFETAAAIRQRQKSADTPIIFLTADTDELQAARGYALGAVDYLVCPFLPEVLRTKVKVFVTLSRANERLKREAEQAIALTREQAARAAAEEQSRRLRVLVEAGGVLTRSLDGSGFERQLVPLLVPLLADEAGLVFPEKSPHGPSSTWARSAADGVPVARSDDATPLALAGPVADALASGRPVTIRGSDGRGVLGIAVPLAVHGEIYGVLAMSRLASGRTFADTDLELIDLVANRTAIALENRRLYRELQARDRRKDEFLATLSHELRNPLGAITMAVRVLEMTASLEGPAAHAGQVIGRQSSHLSRMVEDLLEVSRVTTGRIQLTPEPVDLRDIVTKAVDVLRAAGRLEPYELVVRGERVMVNADLARTDQVVTNLLVNAIKYTDPGGRITVDVEIEGDQAVMRVADNGIGISPELLPNLFEVFVQGRQALDRADGGLGIGLALVRKLVELQGGSVEASSRGQGQGSIFTVRLPRILVDQDAVAAEPAGPRARGLRVLLVDDNADLREMLRTLLLLGGHEVHEAASGPEAVAQAASVLPNIALVDLGIPGFDGLEVARRLRSDARTQAIVLVALTGYGQADDQRKTAESGFDGHLVKPVTSERLEEALALAAVRAAGESHAANGATQGAVAKR